MAESGNDVLLEGSKVQNYLRLQHLLSVTATTYLRILFYSKWKTFKGKYVEWENLPANAKQFIESVGQKLYKNAMPIQKKYLAGGNANLWDLLLLIDVLKCFQHNTNETQQQNADNFEKLKQVRNQQAHLGGIEVDEEYFDQMWKVASEALLSLGLPQDVLEAAKIVKMQAKQDPNPQDKINEDNLTKSDDLKCEGNRYFNEKNFEEAIRLYSQAIMIPHIPNDHLAVLYSNRSNAYLKSGNLENAKEDAKGALHLNPTWWRGYHRLASVYEKQEQFSNALMYYELALEMAPTKPEEVKDSRDVCRYMIGKRQRAEHTDPLNFLTTFEDSAKLARAKGLSSTAQSMAAAQKLMYKLGHPVGICGEGHNYLLGKGVPQNYEMAAQIFAKAASQGNAEGMYNLARLMYDGNGVQRNVAEANKLLFAAADQDPLMEIIPGSRVKLPNIGVMEAQHALGLAYAEGTGVERDFRQAMFWYKKALKNGMGNSGNNLALMYAGGIVVDRNILTAFDFWKVAALLGCVRAMENMAHNYMIIGNVTHAQKWYTVAVENGSIDLLTSKQMFFVGTGRNSLEGFDTAVFLQEIKDEMMKGPYQEYLLSKQHDIPTFKKPMKCNPLSAEYKVEIVLEHRNAFKEMRCKGQKAFIHTTQPANLQPKPVADIFDLKPIFFKDVDQKKDHIYEGFAIKLTTIEDALVGEERKSVGLIATDENGDTQRVFVYNYPQTKETREVLGFGSRVTVMNPYFRITADGKPAIRIDDPSLLFIHTKLRDPNQCRFCGKEKGKVACRKCRRVYYCSKLCLKKDAEELSHELVCVKRL